MIFFRKVPTSELFYVFFKCIYNIYNIKDFFYQTGIHFFFIRSIKERVLVLEVFALLIFCFQLVF